MCDWDPDTDEALWRTWVGPSIFEQNAHKKKQLPWSHINLVMACAWALTVPAAFLFGFWHSLAFVSFASIYANVATHIAGWRADRPNA